MWMATTLGLSGSQPNTCMPGYAAKQYNHCQLDVPHSKPLGPPAAAPLDLTCTPRLGRSTRPLAISCGTTRPTVSAGMAKPTPAEVPVGVKMAVLRPIRRPLLSSRGPPLLPERNRKKQQAADTDRQRGCKLEHGTTPAARRYKNEHAALPSPSLIRGSKLLLDRTGVHQPLL